MSSNHLSIKQSHNAFRSKIENIKTTELSDIIKNYKKLLPDLNDVNGSLLIDLIQIAEKELVKKQVQ